MIVPMSTSGLTGPNPCEGTKPDSVAYFDNTPCGLFNGTVGALEQSGTNVTAGYVGDIDATGRDPITTPYFEAGLCPVNVHWHLGTEHYSVGQYDEHGTGPTYTSSRRRSRRMQEEERRLREGGLERRLPGLYYEANGEYRRGFRCSLYDSYDPIFTTEYNWSHCVDMHVGETYEVHWPHSAAGACGTPNQYQSPFYDGVFCMPNIISLDPLNTFTKIGVQAQIFTIVNDESYFYPDLMRGMIVDGEYGADMAKYTGSTTGTTRDNTVCSRYTPITWQVDRMCHLISASSFDKMCADMKTVRDDMSMDLHAHGARELVATEFAANNHQRL
jgi:hypothetical protein